MIRFVDDTSSNYFFCEFWPSICSLQSRSKVVAVAAVTIAANAVVLFINDNYMFFLRFKEILFEIILSL